MAALRKIGTYKTGVHRPTYSHDDMTARRWLADRLAEAGYTAEIDGIGNVYGIYGQKGKLLAGSHLETLNQAGWLDGALGVAYALEVGMVRPDLVDVVAWADEEGHYGSFLGSRSFIGEVTEDEIDQASNRYDGTSLRVALQRAGLRNIARNKLDAGRYIGYLEAHIEQGIELEAMQKTIGIVSGLVGVWQYRINVMGQQNHAGTTSMSRRKDAGAAAIRLASEVERRFRSIAGNSSVWTFGDVKLSPGLFSIIPGTAELLLQFRDADLNILGAFEQALEDIVMAENRSGPCRVLLEAVSRSMPASMSRIFQDHIQTAAQLAMPGRHCIMPSGAQHDAQILAKVLPSAMMFVPSKGGISHHWDEDTAEEDIVKGCQVFANAVELICLERGFV